MQETKDVLLISLFFFIPLCPSRLSRCCYILDANGEARSFRPRDRDEMVKQVRPDDTKLIYVQQCLQNIIIELILLDQANEIGGKMQALSLQCPLSQLQPSCVCLLHVPHVYQLCLSAGQC